MQNEESGERKNATAAAGPRPFRSGRAAGRASRMCRPARHGLQLGWPCPGQCRPGRRRSPESRADRPPSPASARARSAPASRRSRRRSGPPARLRHPRRSRRSSRLQPGAARAGMRRHRDTGRSGSSPAPHPRPRRTVSESGASWRTPAFRTTASRPPSVSTAARTDSSTAPASRVSARTNVAPVRSAASFPRLGSRPVKTTPAPSLRRRSTTAAPIPEVPPVTSARTALRRPTARDYPMRAARVHSRASELTETPCKSSKVRVTLGPLQEAAALEGGFAYGGE